MATERLWRPEEIDRVPEQHGYCHQPGARVGILYPRLDSAGRLRGYLVKDSLTAEVIAPPAS